MNTVEKLSLVNSLYVEEVNHVDGLVFYIMVEKTQHNIDILKQMGVTEDDIEQYKDHEDEEFIEVSRLIEKYVGMIRYENGELIEDY